MAYLFENFSQKKGSRKFVKNGQLYHFLDVRNTRQASKKFYNKFSENLRSQIVLRTDIFRKLTLGARALWLARLLIS